MFTNGYIYIFSTQSKNTINTYSNGVKDGRVKTIENCDTNELYNIMPLLVGTIVSMPLPFVRTLRNPLIEAFNKRVDASRLLEQRFHLFLYSFRQSDQVMDIWRDHLCNPSVIDNEKAVIGLNPNAIDEHDSKIVSPPTLNTNVNSNASHTSGYFGEFSDMETDNEFDLGYDSPQNATEYESHYLHNLIETNPDAKTDHEVNGDSTIYDLLPPPKANDSKADSDARVHLVRVAKVFNSNAKPLLLSMHHQLVNNHHSATSLSNHTFGGKKRKI